DALSGRSAAALAGAVERQRARLARAAAGLRAGSPTAQLRLARQRLNELAGRAHRAARHHLALAREQAGQVTRALAAVSPLAVLGRGYALVRRPDGAVIRRAAEVAAGETLNVRVREGEFTVRVEDA
ncbi:MAG: hypothetical protein JNK29_16940, partial [Anaerolineales bacterium]|nr:hypothetical protein [Anaerolineales bacterium]